MSKTINDKEFAVLIALPGPARYSHFIGQVADWEQVWSLRGPGGWVLAADDNGKQLTPVWPHARYAQASAIGAWAETTPEAIPLDRWLAAWTPGLTRDGRGVAVFPVPSGAGINVEPVRLADDLTKALEQCE